LVQGGTSDDALLRGEPGQECANMPAAAIDGDRGQTTLSLHVPGKLVNEISAGPGLRSLHLQASHELQPVGSYLHESLAPTGGDAAAASSVILDPTIGNRCDLPGCDGPRTADVQAPRDDKDLTRQVRN
jgi:hypothetical protein